jgi:hypothetical protein
MPEFTIALKLVAKFSILSLKSIYPYKLGLQNTMPIF